MSDQNCQVATLWYDNFNNIGYIKLYTKYYRNIFICVRCIYRNLHFLNPTKNPNHPFYISPAPWPRTGPHVGVHADQRHGDGPRCAGGARGSIPGASKPPTLGSQVKSPPQVKYPQWGLGEHRGLIVGRPISLERDGVYILARSAPSRPLKLATRQTRQLWRYYPLPHL